MKNLALLVSSVFIFSACGSSTPGAVRSVVTAPGYDDKPQQQGEAQVTGDSKGAFAVQMDGLDANRILNLRAGVKGSVKISVTAVNDTVQALELTNIAAALPKGATLTQNSKFSWTFSWTAPANYPKSKLDMNFNLYATASSSTIEPIQAVGQTVSFQIVIRDSVQKPIFKNISADFSKGLQEGAVVPFYVDVLDPSGAQAPDISWAPSDLLSNHELAPSDGTKLMSIDPAHPKVEQVSPGLYRAYFIFDTSKNLQWPKGSKAARDDDSAASVKECFDIVASNSSTKQKMEPFDLCPVIAFASSTPHASFDAGTQFILKAGAPVTLNLTVHAAGALSVLDAKVGVKNFAKWPGNPSFVCDAQTGQDMKCHLNWTPSCNAKSTNYEFAVSATSTFAGSNRKPSAPSRMSNQTLTVEPDLDSCPLPAKAPAKTSAKTPSKAAVEAFAKTAAKSAATRIPNPAVKTSTPPEAAKTTGPISSSKKSTTQSVKTKSTAKTPATPVAIQGA